MTAAFLATPCDNCTHPRHSHKLRTDGGCVSCGCYEFVSPIKVRTFDAAVAPSPSLRAECDTSGCGAHVTLSPPPADDVVRPALRLLGWYAPDASTIQRCPRCSPKVATLTATNDERDVVRPAADGEIIDVANKRKVGP